MLRTCSSSTLSSFTLALRWSQDPQCMGSAQIHLGALRQHRSRCAMLSPAEGTLVVLSTSSSKQCAGKGREACPFPFSSDRVKRSGQRIDSVAVVYPWPGLLEPQPRMDVSSGRCPLEANCSWQLLSFHPMLKTAALTRTSLCTTSNHKIFVSSFPESRRKPDSEVIHLCWMKRRNAPFSGCSLLSK